MIPQERSLLESLDAIVQADAVRAQIEPMIERVVQKLRQDYTAALVVVNGPGRFSNEAVTAARSRQEGFGENNSSDLHRSPLSTAAKQLSAASPLSRAHGVCVWRPGGGGGEQVCHSLRRSPRSAAAKNSASHRRSVVATPAALDVREAVAFGVGAAAVRCSLLLVNTRRQWW